MDTTFTWTILFLIASSLLGIILKGRSRDRCLRDFEDFPTALRLADGKEIWGRLRVANSGLELNYDTPHVDGNHQEISYLLFNSEFEKIWYVARHAGELSIDDRRKRDDLLQKMSKPSFTRRLLRRIGNLFSSLKDAVMQIVGMTVQQAKKVGAGSTILSTQDKYITQMGQQVVSTSAYEYDILLEGLLGRRVVVERMKDGVEIEIVGILRNYTGAFLEILDATMDEEYILTMDSPLVRRLSRSFLIEERDGGGWQIRRTGTDPISLLAFRKGEAEEEVLSTDMSEGEAIPLPDWGDNASLRLHLKKETDLVMPRSSTVVRHGAT